MTRRPYDSTGAVRYMEYRTRYQPNCRMLRSLRHLQGLDYLHTLRGLEKIDFLDYDLWTAARELTQVRDWTFVMDVNNSVRRPKQPDDKEMSQVRNLHPLVQGFTISEENWTVLEDMMEGRPLVPHFPPMHDPQVAAGFQRALNVPEEGMVPVATETIVIDDDGDTSMTDAIIIPDDE